MANYVYIIFNFIIVLSQNKIAILAEEVKRRAYGHQLEMIPGPVLPVEPSPAANV
jgi:hypothetical protein